MLSLDEIEYTFINNDDLSESEREILLIDSIAIFKEEATKVGNQSAQLAYAIGYLYYLLNNMGKIAVDDAKNWFLKAIELDNESNFSKFYLGSIYYHEGAYKKALTILNNISAGYFHDKHDQHWRDLSVDVYKVCGKAILGRWEFEEITKVCLEYERDKEMNLDFPDELIQACIHINKSYPSADAKEFAKLVVKMIANNREYINWYAVELKQLESFICS